MKIVEEIGRRMDIEDDAQITEQDMMTERFEKLALEDALQRLSSNYAYLMNTEKKMGKITKIVLLSEGSGKGTMKPVSPKQVSQKTEETSAEMAKDRPEPFKFTFDPKKYLKKKK